MLKNVCNPGGVFRDGQKGYAKRFVGIVIFYPKGIAAESVMPELINCGVNLSDFFFSQQGKVAVGLTLNKICHGRFSKGFM